jgi:sugar O-acyltransferase (sialic acid O-acetyltransferase NeuD family)
MRAVANRDWLIIGSGGHARSAQSVIEYLGDRVAAVTTVDERSPDSVASSVTYFLDDSDALTYAADAGLSVCIGIGSSAVRKRLVLKILSDVTPGLDLRPLVAASATVDQSAELGPLVQVFEHSHVGPRAKVGAGTIVNTSAIVEHDAVIGRTAHLAPGAVLLGGAKLGNDVLLGSGSRVLPGVSVTAGTIVGAGGVVVQDLVRTGTYVGMPATAVPDERCK